jgi:prepilin-type N-terminal cleavage/methylation domain-containing protein
MKGRRFHRGFTLLEVLVVIALIATISGVSMRLLSRESIFRSSVQTLQAYLQSVNDYAQINKSCYLLLGNYSNDDQRFTEFILATFDGFSSPTLLKEYAHGLGRQEQITFPADSAHGSNFQSMDIPLPKELSGHWIAIPLGSTAAHVSLVLAYQNAQKTFYATFEFSENGSVTTR